MDSRPPTNNTKLNCPNMQMTLHFCCMTTLQSINRDKCKGLWSGSMKHRTDRPLDLDWYNDLLPDPILGTIFGNIDCTQRNLQPRLQKVTNTITAWNHRALSYKGNVKPHVHKRQITILLTSISGISRHFTSLFLIASSFFTSASPFLVPVLYISPSLEKDVVLNMNK